MLNELEQKIRKAIPELNELGVGCEIEYKGNLNTIDNNYISVYDGDIEIYDFGTIVKCSYSIIGKPIQLNHVLEYVQYSMDWKDLLKLWNLKSNLLSDQSSELITFLNNL